MVKALKSLRILCEELMNQEKAPQRVKDEYRNILYRIDEITQMAKFASNLEKAYKGSKKFISVDSDGNVSYLSAAKAIARMSDEDIERLLS